MSKNVFVPLIVGGGIRDSEQYTALDIAEIFFRSGADKVSIGSDAVYAAMNYYQNGNIESSIHSISRKYGK